MGGLRQFILAPHAFFESRAESPSLVGPTLVVVANALSATTLVLFLFWVFSGVFSVASRKVLVYAISGETVSAPRDLVLGAVLTLAMYFIVWGVVTGFVLLGSRYYDTDGSTRGTLALVGWSLLPVLLGNVVSTVLLVALLAGAPPLGNESAVSEWVLTNVSGDLSYQIVRGVRPLLTAWTVYLWVLAGMYGGDLSRRRALVAVAVPGVFALGNGVVTYVFLLA